jgi:hypothetical protein
MFDNTGQQIAILTTHYLLVAKVRERLAVKNEGHTDFIGRGSISRS